MRPQKVNDRDLIDILFDVIRTKGYEGASIGELADLSGLKKASLYHRFPGGKEEMVRAVLKDVTNWHEKHIAGVLESPNLDAEIKLEVALSNINTHYRSGKKNCIFGALALDNGLQLFGQDIKGGIRVWFRAFTAYGQNIGLTRQAAEKKANQVISLIQGGLVLCRTMEDKSAWNEALKHIEELYQY